MGDGPIEINRDSWHGRLTRYVFGPDHIIDTPSICPYFWSVWVAVIFAPIKWCVVKVEDWGHWVRFGIGLMVALMFVGIAFRPQETLYVMILVVVYSSLVQIIWWVGMWYRDTHPYVHKYRPPKIRKKHEPSFVGEWFKARKGKVCPPIREVRDK